MIKLGTYKIENSFYKSRQEISERLLEYAKREYNNGIRQAGWKGYIYARNTSNMGMDYYTFYYYTHPSTTYNWYFKAHVGDNALMVKW